MKTAYIVIAILAIALIIVTVKLVSNTNNTSSEATNQLTDAVTSASSKTTSGTAISNIMTRASVRSYTDQPVSKEQIDTLLRAAMSAPTARNSQPWQFVVITDRQILDSIASHCGNISMAAQSSVAIAVCGDMDKALEGDGRDYWIQDCSAATENLLLAAHAMYLGAVWCGIYPIEERVEFISALLKLPKNLIPLNIIPVGYPTATSTPKDKYDAAKIIVVE